MTSEPGSTFPRPQVNELTRPFWNSAREGRLSVQACAACGRLRHPPRWACPWCGSREFEWRNVSGRGRVWSFVVAHPPVLPAFEERVPMPIALVELEEDQRIRMVAALAGEAGAKLRIGAPVQVEFDEVDEELTLPRWRLAVGISVEKLDLPPS